MAPPLKNQFWRNRSEHGRGKLFEDSSLLWEECKKYFNWCDAHPWNKVEYKDGKLVKIPHAIPYTLSGLCLFLNASESWWKNFRKNDTLSNDFLSVIEQVEETIRTQKFNGAAVGAFNANLMARDMGMADRTEVSAPNGAPLFHEKSDEELMAILKSMNDKLDTKS